MANVKKRENMPEEFKPLETAEDVSDVVITIGDTDYPLPVLTLGEYKKMVKKTDKALEKDMNELENIEFVQQFFLDLLKRDNPELTKGDMDGIPLYQCSAEYLLKVKLALYRIPFGSGRKEAKA